MSLNKPPLDSKHVPRIMPRDNIARDFDDSKLVTQADPIEFIKPENITLVNEYSDVYCSNAPSARYVCLHEHISRCDFVRDYICDCTSVLATSTDGRIVSRNTEHTAKVLNKTPSSRTRNSATTTSTTKSSKSSAVRCSASATLKVLSRRRRATRRDPRNSKQR